MNDYIKKKKIVSLKKITDRGHALPQNNDSPLYLKFLISSFYKSIQILPAPLPTE